jgi:hypothetical protein
MHGRKLCIRRGSRVLHRILARFYGHKERVWDDKEDPTMVDEVLEGGGRSRLMDADF